MLSKKKYNFLFVSAPYSGINVFVHNLVESIREYPDIDATCVWLNLEQWRWVGKISPFNLNDSLGGGWISKREVYSLEKQGKRFDCAFFNNIVPLTFLRSFQRRVPSVLSLDSTPQLMAPMIHWYSGIHLSRIRILRTFKKSLDRGIYRDARFLLPWSSAVKDSLINDYGVSEEKIAVVPPGVDISRWKANERMSGNNRPLRILFVGADFMRKGGDLVVRAASKKEFQKHEFHLVTKTFVGSKPSNVFIHDNLEPNKEELKKLYRECDIFVLPTHADLCPTNSICEAMAMELPVISTSVGGLNEIVVDGENGFLISPDDEQAFEQKLSLLCSSDERRKTFGANGRKKIETKYNLTKNAESILTYMKKAADASRESLS